METTLSNESVKHLTFKGRFKGHRCKFIPKVIVKRFTITDSLCNRFKTTISVYIPKIDSKHIGLRTMMHIVNGAGSCQLRVKDPRDLANHLEEIVNVLRTDNWIEKAFRVEEISDHIKDTGGLPLVVDEDIIDINEWKEHWINDVEVDYVDVETERIKDLTEKVKIRKEGSLANEK